LTKNKLKLVIKVASRTGPALYSRANIKTY
jgi:hypothetical protein